MSVSKILNRPMFRKAALRKGHLKPINANTGIMVGQPITSAPVPALRKPPTFMERMAVSGPSRFLKSAISIPSIGGYMAGETVAKGLGIENPIGQMGFGTAGSIAATKALPGLASLPVATSAALMAGPAYLMYAGSKERERIAKMTPKERAAHSAKSKQFGMSYLNDEQFTDQFKPRLDEILAKKDKPERKLVAKGKPGSGRVGFQDRLTEKENESDIASGVVDIDKVVKNVAPNPSGGDQGITADAPIPEKKKDVKVAKVEDAPDTDEKANDKIVNKPIVDGAPGKVTAGDGTPVTDNVIQRAKEIRRELMAGQSSQAKLVFMANLASGLMSGTTAKAGIGGALEVFGRALGPAVNNYAAIKLKENELENEFMSDALELASDEIEARNSILEAPDYGKTTAGIIQFTDANGNVKNMSARQLEDSTIQVAVPGKTDEYVRQLFQTVPVGTFDRFVTTKYATKAQFDTLSNLSGKYKAYGLGSKTIDILRDAEAMDKKFGGPAGRLNLVTGRLGDAFSDLGLSFASNKESGFEKIDEIKDGMVKDLMDSGMKEDEARKFLENRFGSTKRMFEDNLKSMGVFKDESDQANLERLAINETILTYALANSLKDKDRLTQKDIQMAKELVNIFPLLRGQKTVIKSLEAVNETILGDIERLENDYQFSYFGDSSTIDNYRRKYGLLKPGQEGEPLPNYYKDTTTQDLLEAF